MPTNWKKLIGLETKADAVARHQHLAGAIRRYRLEQSPLCYVADCTADLPCGRDGCPRCLRRFRKHLVQAVDALGFDPSGWSRVSIILADHTYQSGRLSDFDLKLESKALARRLARSALADAVFVGGWDVSFNQFENVDIGWKVHLYGLINVLPSPLVKSHWRKVVDLDPDAAHPLLMPAVDPDKFLEGVTYTHKALFSRRSGYFEHDRLKKDGTPRRNSRDLDLKPEQLLELTAWLSQHNVGSRLILRNLKRVNPPLAKLRLKRLP